MIRETLIHLDESLDSKAKTNLAKAIRHDCGDLKAHHHSNSANMMFIAFDDSKVSIHDLTKIGKKHGGTIEVIDF